MSKGAKRKLDRLVKLHRGWLRDTEPGLREGAVRRLQDNIAEATLPALRATDSLLSRLAICYGTRGVVELVDGDPGGWDTVFLSCAFHVYQLRLDYALWTRVAGEPSVTIEKVACALCFSLANRLTDWTQSFGDVLAQADWNGQLVNREYWQERVFEPFALRLANIGRGTVANVALEAEAWGVYSALLANWDSPTLFSKAIEAACDYHCENMDDDGTKDWDPEFRYPPFDLVPWEILAIRTVRDQLGLPTSLPEHPLLVSISTFSPRDDFPANELLRAVEQLRLSLSMTVA